jgi:hypothetical protein
MLLLLLPLSLTVLDGALGAVVFGAPAGGAVSLSFFTLPTSFKRSSAARRSWSLVGDDVVVIVAAWFACRRCSDDTAADDADTAGGGLMGFVSISSLASKDFASTQASDPLPTSMLLLSPSPPRLLLMLTSVDDGTTRLQLLAWVVSACCPGL